MSKYEILDVNINCQTGSYGEFMGDKKQSEHIFSMKENNQLLYDADILTTLKRTLDYGCHQLEKLSM